MLLLTMLQTVFCLMLCCDAAIEIHGALREIRPSEVSVHCYFATGTLEGLEIIHTRELFLHRVFGRSQTQRMSFTSTRLQGGNASRNLLPLGGTTKISGNLKKGVIFTLTKARCQDAGDYTCLLDFRALGGGSIQNRFTSDKERLDLFPDILRFSALPRQFHFDESEEPENLKVTCATFTTVEVICTK
ncbi:hypothetical protein V1264_010523 [Littorina saxatilis]|uniref:Immunoglobulin V-set domain-containing protein n=1 Tax=Littorina saxatilis TaxID=31220 RepID=A0AAN9G0L8_9CAEN